MNTDMVRPRDGWSCDESEGKCRNAHGCHCAEITAQATRIRELEASHAAATSAGVAKGIEMAARQAKSAWLTTPCADIVDAGVMEDFCNSLSEDIRALSPSPGMVLVPLEPSEAMWGSDLVRCIMRWLRQDRPTPAKLFADAKATGIEIPDWLRNEGEMQALDHVVSKGTCAVIVYRAMIGANESRSESN